jgi:predicted AlkP superfamily phosphohydrolase/phosphomutase
MPTWQRLAAGGLTSTLDSVWPVAAGAWVTLLTGLEVAQHGVLDVCEIDARQFPSMSARVVDARGYADQTWLTLASEAGRSIAAISVPMTAPAWRVNGVLIPGVPVFDEVRPPTWPPELRNRVSPVSKCRFDEVDVRDLEACRRYLDFDLQRIVDIARLLHPERSWDVFLVVFKVPDVAHHLLCENPAVPDWRDIVDEYLVKSDAALGEVLDIVDPDSVVMVLSDHGSRAMPRWIFRVMTWLERQGFLARRQTAVIGTDGLQHLHRGYRALLANPWARRLKSRLPSRVVERVRAVGHHWPFVDLSRTRVYPVDVFYPLAGFQVNLRGREAHGIVDPADFESTCASLVAQLADLPGPNGGGRLCRRILRREDLFDGAHADRLPDVIAELDADVEADLHFGPDVLSPNPGKASYPYRGYHAREALLLMNGPGIVPQIRADGVNLRDIMPTIMKLLDLPVPPDRRGRAIV